MQGCGRGVIVQILDRGVCTVMMYLKTKHGKGDNRVQYSRKAL